MALLEREPSGKGQWVQTSLLQAQIAMLDFQAARWTDRQARCRGRRATTTRPASRPACSRPRDGHINIAASGGKIWERFCEAIDAPELLTDDPDFSTAKARSKNRDALNAEIDKRQATTAARWSRCSTRPACRAGPIYSIDEVFADPQVQHLGMAQPMTHPSAASDG